MPLFFYIKKTPRCAVVDDTDQPRQFSSLWSSGTGVRMGRGDVPSGAPRPCDCTAASRLAAHRLPPPRCKSGRPPPLHRPMPVPRPRPRARQVYAVHPFPVECATRLLMASPPPLAPLTSLVYRHPLVGCCREGGVYGHPHGRGLSERRVGRQGGPWSPQVEGVYVLDCLA